MALLRLLNDWYSERALDLILERRTAWTLQPLLGSLRLRDGTGSYRLTIRATTYSTSGPALFVPVGLCPVLHLLRPGVLLSLTRRGLWFPELGVRLAVETVLASPDPDLGASRGAVVFGRLRPVEGTVARFTSEGRRLLLDGRPCGRVVKGAPSWEIDSRDIPVLRRLRGVGQCEVRDRGFVWTSITWTPQRIH